ncbi:hypothetical protein [Denitromonas sp.]|uniref:hypothetical protein n=1 Tax=Denitromonas sp. TaxID=2734609 RepID=UPI002AFFF39C|nr:hypothetical protein [Denitromonas sp.]
MKTMFAPLRDVWTGWWRCHKTWRRLRRQLDRAGVSNYDPLYPLIVEIGLVPARLGRILVLAVVAGSVVLFGLWGASVSRLASDGITVVAGANGKRLIIIEAPKGGRWLHCSSNGHVCFELNASDQN